MALGLVLLLSFHQFKSGNSFHNGWKDRLPAEGSKNVNCGSLKKTANTEEDSHRGEAGTSHWKEQRELEHRAQEQHKGTEQRRGEDGEGTWVSCCRERLKQAGRLGGREKGWPSHQDVVLLSEIEG